MVKRGFYTGLCLVSSQCEAVESNDSWFQDHLVFGYTHRPGQEPIDMVLLLPSMENLSCGPKHIMKKT